MKTSTPCWSKSAGGVLKGEAKSRGAGAGTGAAALLAAVRAHRLQLATLPASRPCSPTHALLAPSGGAAVPWMLWCWMPRSFTSRQRQTVTWTWWACLSTWWVTHLMGWGGAGARRCLNPQRCSDPQGRARTCLRLSTPSPSTQPFCPPLHTHTHPPHPNVHGAPRSLTARLPSRQGPPATAACWKRWIASCWSCGTRVRAAPARNLELTSAAQLRPVVWAGRWRSRGGAQQQRAAPAAAPCTSCRLRSLPSRHTARCQAQWRCWQTRRWATT